MSELRHLADITQLKALKERLYEDPNVVRTMTRSQMVAHMQRRAAIIESEIIRRYTGRNAKLREAKYQEALDTEFTPKIVAWTQERNRILREKK